MYVTGDHKVILMTNRNNWFDFTRTNTPIGRPVEFLELFGNFRRERTHKEKVDRDGFPKNKTPQSLPPAPR